MGVTSRERLRRRCALASCAAVLAACTGAGCSFPDVSLGNSSDAHVSDPASSGAGASASGAGSSSSGTGGGAGEAAQAPGTEGDAPDGVDAPIAEDSSSGAIRNGSSASGSSGAGSGSGSSGSSGSASGTGGSSGGPGPCTCGPGKTLAYPTNISCSAVLDVLGVLCSGPGEGFSDNGPPCGQAGTLTTCSLVGLNLNAMCVMGTGSTAIQSCR
jgi:hypothetical protein